MGGYVIPETNDRADDAYDQRRQEELEIVDQAFRDILSGNFDSDAVHEALSFGHHSRYAVLREQRDAAMRAVRHSRAA